jgi:hypothetical protein
LCFGHKEYHFQPNPLSWSPSQNKTKYQFPSHIYVCTRWSAMAPCHSESWRTIAPRYRTGPTRTHLLSLFDLS